MVVAFCDSMAADARDNGREIVSGNCWKCGNSRTGLRCEIGPPAGVPVVAQRPCQLGLRFSAKAFGPSTVSSLLVMATKAG